MEEDQDVYTSLLASDDMSPETIRMHQEKINSALLQNQLEHNKFQECQIELEDNLQEASFASEYKHGLMERQLGKHPKMMDPKFDGPNLYSVLGSVAAEVVDLSETKPSSKDDLEFDKKVNKMQNVYEQKLTEVTAKVVSLQDSTVKKIPSK